MDFGIIFSIIISLILIIIIHNLFIYFKDNLTAPKVKDFINKPNKNYEEIYIFFIKVSLVPSAKVLSSQEHIDIIIIRDSKKPCVYQKQ